MKTIFYPAVNIYGLQVVVQPFRSTIDNEPERIQQLYQNIYGLQVVISPFKEYSEL
jgi:hypothetical protein